MLIRSRKRGQDGLFGYLSGRMGHRAVLLPWAVQHERAVRHQREPFVVSGGHPADALGVLLSQLPADALLRLTGALRAIAARPDADAMLRRLQERRWIHYRGEAVRLGLDARYVAGLDAALDQPDAHRPRADAGAALDVRELAHDFADVCETWQTLWTVEPRVAAELVYESGVSRPCAG